MRFLPRNERNLLTSCAIVISLGLLTGCPQAAAPDPSFMAGSGGSEFGTIDDGKGTTFKITALGDGFEMTSNGAAGNADYEVDGQGRLTYIETDSVEARLIYNADGSTSVSGSIELETGEKTFDGVIPAGTIKVRSRSQGQGSVCGAVDFFCTNLDAVLLYVEAALLRQAGYQDNPNNDFAINIANGVIELAVSRAMGKVTGPAQAFCGVWPEIRPELGDLCN